MVLAVIVPDVAWVPAAPLEFHVEIQSFCNFGFANSGQVATIGNENIQMDWTSNNQVTIRTYRGAVLTDLSFKASFKRIPFV